MIVKNKSLTPTVLNIIRDKATEYPFTGEYEKSDQLGTYLCRQCGLALFRSQAKFHSQCGWPSFDETIGSNVTEVLDADGRRLEIVCVRCKGHLGHVFRGEGYTSKNTRHCLNSASLDFVASATVVDSEEAIFAAGCFWGVEHYFNKLKGVLKVEVGYTGGHVNNPRYDQICEGNTGHYEAIRVVFDPSITSFENITRYFFEIHDFSQSNGQGPDIGQQYLSVAFYYNDEQKKIIDTIINQLSEKNYVVQTKVLPVSTFWPAEIYHQKYYEKTGKEPYCHRYNKIF